MATTKTKNGQIPTEAMADMADKVTQEAKAVTDVWLDVTNKAIEETKTVLETQQKMLQDGFATWQKYNRAYVDFVTGATQQTFEEALALRERWGKITEGHWQKSQEQWAAEQTAASEVIETFWTQAQTVSERVGKLYTPVK